MKQSITKAQVEQLQEENKSVKLVDIRSAAEYEKLHLPGTENIPAEDLPDRLIPLAKDHTIVCICNKGHDRSQNAAEFLYNNGFVQSFFLEGGTIGWLAETGIP